MSILACSSHLLVDLPLFGAPVFAVAGTVVWMARGERHRKTQLNR